MICTRFLVIFSFSQWTLFPCLNAQQYHTETKCFQTVKYYYSNPEITDRNDYLLVYKNQEFVNISFCASCDEDMEVQIELIQLSIPLREEDYCLQNQHFSYRDCNVENQCDCCDISDRCHKNVTERYKQFCAQSSNCSFVVQSEFLHDCPGRNYNCSGEKCHSRWVEVSYSCNLFEKFTQTPSNTNDRIVQSDVPATEEVLTTKPQGTKAIT